MSTVQMYEFWIIWSLVGLGVIISGLGDKPYKYQIVLDMVCGPPGWVLMLFALLWQGDTDED